MQAGIIDEWRGEMAEAHQTFEWICELKYGAIFLMRCYQSIGHRIFSEAAGIKS